MSKRLIAGGMAAFMGLGLTIAASMPAQAAPPADGVSQVPAVTGPITETKSTTDAGGIQYKISVKWNKKYVDAAGNTRVSVNPLVVYRPDSLTPAFAEDDGVDLHFDVRQGTSLANFQHVLKDNVDLDVSTDDQASFNPRNPRSNASDTHIRVKVGTDGDGLGNSPWVVFYQPEGVPSA